MLKNSYCLLLQRKRERMGRFFFALTIQLKQQGVRNDINSSESTVSVIGRPSIWELWHSNLQQGKKSNAERNLNCWPNFGSPPLLLTEVQMIPKGSLLWGCQTERCNTKEAGKWVTAFISVIGCSIQIKVLCFVHQRCFAIKTRDESWSGKFSSVFPGSNERSICRQELAAYHVFDFCYIHFKGDIKNK